MGKVLNIDDIAKLAGVSRSTVSRVLTNNKNVRRETALKVRKAIQEANYRPSILARGLATGRLNIIGMLLSETRQPFYLEMIERLDAEIRDRGYILSLCYLGRDEKERCSTFLTLQKYGFSGFVIGDIRNESTFLDEIGASGLPLVFFNRYIETLPEYDAVVVDNYHGGYLAGKHLAEQGHRDFAALTGPLKSSASRERYRGFADALSESGIGLRPEMVGEGDLTLESGAAFAERLLAEDGPGFSAIFAGNDSMAIGFMHRCREKGLQIPRNLGVVGFDDLPFAGASVFDLTTVQQPYAELASMTADRVVSRIEGGADLARVSLLTPTLVIRGSTMPRN